MNLGTWGPLAQWGAASAVIPAVSITTQPQTVTTGDSVTLSADTTNADSYLWTCTSGQSPTIANDTVEDTSAVINEAGEHTFRLTVTSSTGDTAFDEVVITAQVPQTQDSSVTFTLTNMASGSYLTTVFIPDNDQVVFHGLKQWNGGTASFNLSGVAPGTSCEAWVRSTTGNGRGVQEGVSS